MTDTRDNGGPEMTDIELLELAALAAGYRAVRFEGSGMLLHGIQDHWNPLTDDGDALRLAVQMEMDVCQQIQTNDPATPAGCVVVSPGGHTCFQANGTDAQAATRRAIVRAAAEVGRQLKESEK